MKGKENERVENVLISVEKEPVYKLVPLFPPQYWQRSCKQFKENHFTNSHIFSNFLKIA